MMMRRARVVGLDGRYALVTALTNSACGGCRMQQGCGASKLGRLMTARPHTLRVENTAAAMLGDDVVLGTSGAALLRAAFLAYAPPLAGVLTGALLGASLGGHQAFVALGAVLGLALGVLLSRVQAARLVSRFVPRMIGCPERAAPLPDVEPQSCCDMRGGA